MKKAITMLFMIGALFCNSQNMPEKKDSVKIYKNEIGINVLPIINELSANSGYTSRQSINYRRMVGDKHIIRFSLGAYALQRSSYPDNNPVYYLTTDTMKVYSYVDHKNGIKPQINVGYEYVLRRKKLIHSFGADLLFNYQHTEQKEVYLWAGQSSIIKTYADLHNIRANRVDSLGSTSSGDAISFGVQFFYNLRVPITKHWLLSTTLGPVTSINRNRQRTTDYRTGETKTDMITNFDFNLVLSDLSIAFRF